MSLLVWLRWIALLLSVHLLSLSSQRVSIKMLMEWCIPNNPFAPWGNCRCKIWLGCLSFGQWVLRDIVQSFKCRDVRCFYFVCVYLRLEGICGVVLLHLLLKYFSFSLCSVNKRLLKIQKLLQCPFLRFTLVNRWLECALFHLIGLFSFLHLFYFFFLLFLVPCAALNYRVGSTFVEFFVGLWGVVQKLFEVNVWTRA